MLKAIGKAELSLASDCEDMASGGGGAKPARTGGQYSRASNEGSRRFHNHNHALTRAFSWLKAPTSAVTFKTLFIYYSKQVLRK